MSTYCVICLDNDKGVEPTNAFCTCNALYHEECLIEWKKRNELCPTCRIPLQIEVTRHPSDSSVVNIHGNLPFALPFNAPPVNAPPVNAPPVNETYEQERKRLIVESKVYHDEHLRSYKANLMLVMFIHLGMCALKAPFEVDGIEDKLVGSFFFVIVETLLMMLHNVATMYIYNQRWIQVNYDARIFMPVQNLGNKTVCVYVTSFLILHFGFSEIRFPHVISVGIQYGSLLVGSIICAR